MFFSFFKILIFWVHRELKGQKTVQNGKKLCLSWSISQEPYIIWLSFMVQMCKMKISPGVFFNFKILILKDCQGAESTKNGPKWQKFLSVASYISGTIYHMIFIHGTHLSFICKRIISPGIFFFFFFFFFKILIFGIIRGRGDGKRAKNGRKWQTILSVSLRISGTIHHVIVIFGTHV